MIYNFDALSFQILTIDRFSHKKGFFNVEARQYAAFSFRVSGTGSFEIGNKRLVTKPGDVLFIPADMPYKVEYSGSESIVVHFEHCNYDEVENLSFESSTVIGRLFWRLLEAWNAHRSVNQAKSIIYNILEEMEKDKKTSMGDTAFAKSVRYMEEHFCEPTLDIDAVCQVGFISASSLQRAFYRHFGLAPKQYLLKLRMNRALELLADGKRSVKEIAFLCGFNDEKYFSRAFKKKYGYPPSQLTSNMIV